MRLEAVFQPLVLGEKHEILTLNTHSWMEKEAEKKFQLLLEDILDKDYDLICFQEINQEITSPEVEVNDLYQALPAAEPIHQDHYVRLWLKSCQSKGKILLDLGL